LPSGKIEEVKNKEQKLHLQQQQQQQQEEKKHEIDGTVTKWSIQSRVVEIYRHCNLGKNSVTL
jgi:hypothetical protein